ncbi:unnamed protein product, partial [Lymnaea stagnalis]
MIQEADTLKKTGAQLMVVGVAKVDRKRLEIIASEPDDIFIAEDYEELQDFSHRVKRRTCEIAPQFQSADDILILVDSSSSITADDYDKELEFVVSLTECFNIGPQAAKFSVVIFSSMIQLVCDFNVSTHRQIKEAVMAAPHLSQSTDTAAALRK